MDCPPPPALTPYDPGVVCNYFVASSPCIHMNGDGSALLPWTPVPVIDATLLNNVLSCGPDGLGVPGALAAFNSVFTPIVAGPADPGPPYPVSITTAAFTLSLTNPSSTETYLAFGHVKQRLSSFSMGNITAASGSNIVVNGGSPIPATQLINHLLGPVAATLTNGIHWSMGDDFLGPLAIIPPLGTVTVDFEFTFDWDGPPGSGDWNSSLFFFETDAGLLFAVPLL